MVTGGGHGQTLRDDERRGWRHARRPEVSLGDALRVMRALDLPPASMPDVAAMLGLEVTLPVSDDATTALRAPRLAAADRGPAMSGRSQRPAPQPPAEPDPLPESADAAGRPTELIVHPAMPGAGSPPRRVRPLDQLVGRATGADLQRAVDLLAPERQRAILGALCSSRRADGEPDIQALVSRIATGGAVTAIPRRLVLTTRLGVRLLVDAGTGMTPFQGDVERLVARVQQLVGADGLEHLTFQGSPLGPRGAGAGAIWNWNPYHQLRPLPLGRPVLALTDLGLGGRHASPSQAAESWLAFDAIVRAAGSRLALLVPYPSQRWPTALRGAVTIVRWDRATSIRDAIDASAAARTGAVR